MEFADLYILRRYRGRGIASEVARQIVLDSKEPWLICVVPEDRQALNFWRRAFERLPLSSARAAPPSEEPHLHKSLVNDCLAEVDTGGATNAGSTAGAGVCKRRWSSWRRFSIARLLGAGSLTLALSGVHRPIRLRSCKFARWPGLD
ncbi:hypothetical protein [Roseateles sp. MS654]|uniref:hypothetical protein n=1 Tax=Roseateles sp. MS654 TaxID=3412685 RepID=UPI003C2DD81F